VHGKPAPYAHVEQQLGTPTRHCSPVYGIQAPHAPLMPFIAMIQII